MSAFCEFCALHFFLCLGCEIRSLLRLSCMFCLSCVVVQLCCSLAVDPAPVAHLSAFTQKHGVVSGGIGMFIFKREKTRPLFFVIRSCICTFSGHAICFQILLVGHYKNSFLEQAIDTFQCVWVQGWSCSVSTSCQTAYKVFVCSFLCCFDVFYVDGCGYCCAQKHRLLVGRQKKTFVLIVRELRPSSADHLLLSSISPSCLHTAKTKQAFSGNKNMFFYRFDCFGRTPPCICTSDLRRTIRKSAEVGHGQHRQDAARLTTYQMRVLHRRQPIRRFFLREVGCRATFVLQHCPKHTLSLAVQHDVLKTRRLADTPEERRACPLLESARLESRA